MRLAVQITPSEWKRCAGETEESLSRLLEAELSDPAEKLLMT